MIRSTRSLLLERFSFSGFSTPDLTLIPPHIPFALILLVSGLIPGALKAQNSQPVEIHALFLREEVNPVYLSITEGISKRSKIPIKWSFKTTDRIDSPETPKWAVIVSAGPEITNQQVPQVRIHDGILPNDLISIQKANNPQPLKLKIARADHPVSKFLTPWTTPTERLIEVKKLDQNYTILAQAGAGKWKSYPAVWLKDNGPVREFYSSIGASPKTMRQPLYLDMLTAGLLWSLKKEIDDYFIAQPMDDKLSSSSVLLGKHLLTDQATKSSSSKSDSAIDGNAETRWKPDKGDIINWWQVTLDEPIEMSSLVIVWHDYSGHPYQVEGSENGVEWELISDIPEQKDVGDISYLEFDGRYQQIRVSNPNTGILSEVSEVAAYQSRRHVPSHLISAAYQNEVKSSKAGNHSFLDRQEASMPQLSTQAAFSVVDEQNDPTQWRYAFSQLALAHSDDTVDGLINRINTTRSGKFRHLAVSALSSLYRTPSGQTWAKSTEIADFLESKFTNKRFNKGILLSELIQNEIPVKNVSKMVASLSNDPGLKQLQLSLLEKNQITYGAIDFLTDIIRSQTEPPENRIRAGALLAKSPDMLAMRDSFEYAAEAADLEVSALLKSLKENPTWEAQIDWLTGKFERGTKPEQHLAGIVLKVIQDDPHARVINKTKAAAILSTQPESMTKPAPTPPVLKELTVQEIQHELNQLPAGDRDKGLTIYENHCSICHSEKVQLLGRSPNIDFLKAILTPDIDIVEDYQTIEFLMKNGNIYSGFITLESSNGVEVIDQAGNAKVLNKSEIKRRRTDAISTMPRHITDDLSVKEFADLLAYLKSL